MKIKILGMCGSARKKGNSEYLLVEALAAAKAALPGTVETELLSVAGKKIAPCLSCFKCAQLKGECCQADGFQALREAWYGADGVIYSVPVYHMSVPAQLRAFFDRLGNCIFCKYQDKVPKALKAVGAIAQGSHLFSGQEQAMDHIIHHALLTGNVPVAGDAPDSYAGAGGWTRNNLDRDGLKKLYEKGDLDAEITLKAVRSLGRRVAQVALLLKTGAAANREMLAKDPMFDALLARLD